MIVEMEGKILLLLMRSGVGEELLGLGKRWQNPVCRPCRRKGCGEWKWESLDFVFNVWLGVLALVYFLSVLLWL